MKKKLAIICNHPTFFISHRLELAKKLKEKGFHITLYTGIEADKANKLKNLQTLEKEKINYRSYEIKPDRWNLMFEISELLKLREDLKKDDIQFIHSTSQKGIILSCLLTIFLNVKVHTISFSGFGSLFLKNSYLFKILKIIYFRIIDISVKRTKTFAIFQNNIDKNIFLDKEIFRQDQIIRTFGSGVDEKLFDNAVSIDKRENIILFPSRVLEDKGAIEFINAAKLLSKKYSNWNFFIAGSCDYASISTINKSLIEDTSKIANITFLGHVNDMPNLLKKTKIVCLPSYREGFPKSLMEACMAGCGIVTTDVPGCNEVVAHGVDGILCEPKNYKNLAVCLEELIADQNLLNVFAKRSRKKALDNYCQNKINNIIIKKIYNGGSFK